MLLTVAELPEYIKRATELLDASERKSLIDYLAMHPRAGDLMEGTGGIRKLRWGRANRGKNEQANLSKAERNELAKLVNILVEVGLRGHHG